MAEPFEIGVVMAGAISAGAYTAGVIDFFFEALDAYYEARKRPDWDGPRHDVRIPIFTGASAGGMTAALAAIHAFRDLDPVRPAAPPPPAARNRLYASWVKDISFERLLEMSDLTGARRAEGLQSALCSDVLDEIVARAFGVENPKRRRDWIGRDGVLRLRLTLTNTRGVPYAFKLFGQDAPESFGMLNHADFQEFAVGDAEALRKVDLKGATPLDAGDFGAPGWAALRQAALATGAYPIGLRPRVIHRADTSFYFKDQIVGWEGGPERRFLPIDPDPSFVVKPYDFVAVDGGTIDNEPLELASRYLAGDALVNNPNGVEASNAVVLIAPFPNHVRTPPEDAGLGLLHVFQSLWSSLNQQARFKPDELHQAADDLIFSRFIIAPKREGATSEAAKTYPIASGVMGGFGGFLHESFRRHDYLLGRRNAQAFLRFNFALPQGNPRFSGVKIDPRWLVRDPGRRTGTVGPEADAKLPPKTFAPSVKGGAPQPGYPIIPLTEALRVPVEIGPVDWPKPDNVELEALRQLVRARANAAIGTLVDQDLPKIFPALAGLVEGLLREGASAFGAHLATEFAMARFARAVRDVEAAFAP